MATQPQIKFIKNLLEERVVEPTKLEWFMNQDYEEYSNKEASEIIEALLEFPRIKTYTSESPDYESDGIQPGFYVVDDVIYKVQRAVYSSGNLYAKVLTETGRFEYVPGAIRKINPEHELTLEQAQRFGRLYGICVVCGRTLTDEESIARGIGPICAEKL